MTLIDCIPGQRPQARQTIAMLFKQSRWARVMSEGGPNANSNVAVRISQRDNFHARFRPAFRWIDFSQYSAGSQGASAAYFDNCIGSSPEEPHQGADAINCQALAQPVGESSSRRRASAIRSISSSVAASGISPESLSEWPSRYRASSRRTERRNALRRFGPCASNHACTQNPNANSTGRNAQNPVDRGHVADSSLNRACQVTRHFVLRDSLHVEGGA